MQGVQTPDGTPFRYPSEIDHIAVMIGKSSDQFGRQLLEFLKHKWRIRTLFEFDENNNLGINSELEDLGFIFASKKWCRQNEITPESLDFEPNGEIVIGCQRNPNIKIPGFVTEEMKKIKKRLKIERDEDFVLLGLNKI